MKNSMLLILFVVLYLPLNSQTKLPTTISSNTMLSKTNSPYLIQQNLSVMSGATLTIEEGCTILFGSGAGINVNGSLIANGIESDSIIFKSQANGQIWNSITGDGFDTIHLAYVKATGGTNFVFMYHGKSIKISHCNITSMATGYGQDCIAAEFMKKVEVEYIELKGQGGKIANGTKNDAIDLDTADSCFINHNHIWNFSDDAIDIGTQTKYALITDNIVHNCNFGVTVGESSKAYLYNNITFHNDGGFQVHDTAVIYCDRNTIYENTDGIECYHSEEGEIKQTGGTAYITNTLFSKNLHHDITKQTSTYDTISYSLSDNDTLPGITNIHADPELVNPANYNFRLQSTSPCMNAGKDSLGNNVNIGADQLVDIVFTSIKYKASNITDFNVFPNPAKDYIQITFQNELDNTVISICDISGKALIKQKLLKNSTVVSIKMLKSGIYFITCSSNKGVNQRFIKI